MADQKPSASGSTAKIEVRAKAGSGKRAVLYTRVSTGEQHPETQLYLRELAKLRRYEIVHECTDTISGAKSNVPVSTSFSLMPAGIVSMLFWWPRSTELPETCATFWKCSMNSAIWELSL